ncbi:MAG: hypothetical protein AABX59_02530 [Nanoarchaeota archaeon]
MDESRLKQVLEVMLMNHAPMDVFGFSLLEHIRKGYKSIFDRYRLEFDGHRKEEEVMRDVYRKIDVSRLDAETGKSIVEECQLLIQEFYDQYFPLLERYIQSGSQPQEVPQRLFQIRDRVMAASREYQKLEANELYEKAWVIGYFSHNCEHKMQWFIDGKPTEIHPEKLELVLSKGS